MKRIVLASLLALCCVPTASAGDLGDRLPVHAQRDTGRFHVHDCPNKPTNTVRMTLNRAIEQGGSACPCVRQRLSEMFSDVATGMTIRVWIARGDRHFHLGSCDQVSVPRYTPTNLSEAVFAGFDPCKSCIKSQP